MKVALIGNGKTGSEVRGLIPSIDLIGPFNSSNPATADKLDEADIIIVFVHHLAFSDIIETLLACKKPVVIGTTGFEFDKALQERITKNGTIWVQGSNFSLGMQLMRVALESINSIAPQFNQFNYHIHEVHHTQKKDIPSGTALMWNQCISERAQITADREGDVKGFHRLNITSESEEIILSHNAKSRKIFAEGALWCAQYIHESYSQIPHGFYTFNQIINISLNKENSYAQAITMDSDCNTTTC